MQKIPLTLVTILVPLLTKQLGAITSLTDSIAGKIASLPASLNMKCNDPRINDIKNDLKKLNQLVAALSKSLASIDKILSILTKIGRVANIFRLVGMAIPSITGVPTGPTTKIITTFTEVGINCLSAVECLKGLLGSLQSGAGRITGVISNATNVIGSICNNEVFNVSADTQQQMRSLNNLNLGDSAKLSSVNFNLGLANQLANGNGGVGSSVNGSGIGRDGMGRDGMGRDGSLYYNGTYSSGSGFSNDSNGIYSNSNYEYVSEFYNEHNVSDDDITTALKLINDLYTEQKSAINTMLSDQAFVSLKTSNKNVIFPELGTPEARALLLYQEAPSQIYYGKSISFGPDNYLYPSLTGLSNDIFSSGKQGDFFIDLENKVIFGPKESDTEWGQPIKY